MEKIGSTENVGHPPELAGLLCDAFICEGFANQDKLIANANVVHMRFAGTWHKLVIDCGVIIWRQPPEPPKPWAVEERGWQYPHADIGGMAGVIGHRLAHYRMETTPSGAKVTFSFGNGRTIVIDNEDDQSTFRIA